MRYAIVSDLHANIQAWEAVYNDLCVQEVDEIICLGDLLGYGPHPQEVFDSCYNTVHHIVMGNHDAAVCGKMDLELFHDDPRRIIEWTQQHLDAFAMDFMRNLPLVLGGDQAFYTHACVLNPASFDYVYEAGQCLPHWDACSEQVIFAGHTHLPHVHMVGEMGQPQSLPAQDIRLSQDIRYFINVGSVGQPRDGDPRASYAIYDSDEYYVAFRRVKYDLDGYFASLKAHGLPVHPSMVGEQKSAFGDFNPVHMPTVMGQSDSTEEEDQAIELNERFETLSDRRNDEAGMRVTAEPKKGRTFKATRAKQQVNKRSSKSKTVTPRRDATQRLRSNANATATTTQRMPKKKSAATPLLLTIGAIVLLGIIIAIIMVITNH